MFGAMLGDRILTVAHVVLQASGWNAKWSRYSLFDVRGLGFRVWGMV